jgi:hypothetical protein
MKELYTAPELKVTCFAPVERLAAEEGVLNFGDLLAASGNQKPADKSGDDLNVKLP